MNRRSFVKWLSATPLVLLVPSALEANEKPEPASIPRQDPWETAEKHKMWRYDIYPDADYVYIQRDPQDVILDNMRMAFWKDETARIVTATDTGKLAGWFMCSIAPGNYGYIRLEHCDGVGRPRKR